MGAMLPTMACLLGRKTVVSDMARSCVPSLWCFAQLYCFLMASRSVTSQVLPCSAGKTYDLTDLEAIKQQYNWAKRHKDGTHLLDM